MPAGHIHSHRPRRRRLNSAERDVLLVALGHVLVARDVRQRAVVRAQRRQARIERRRQRLAAGPRQVVVQVSGLGGGPIAGQRAGRMAHVKGPSGVVVEALVRQGLEAARG